MVKRFGFSMIELIFAIVIVAVAVMSLPMMTQVTSKGSERNLKADEAIFEAYVKAVETTDQTFDEIPIGTSSLKDAMQGSASLQGLKYETKYKVTVEPATFADETNTSQIKKITVTIYDDKGKVITQLHTYKFKM